MNTTLVFVPCGLYKEEPGYLYGRVERLPTTTTFYIVGKSATLTGVGADNNELIGYYCKSNPPNFACSLRKDDWIVISLCSDEFFLQFRKEDKQNSSLSSRSTICIVYDQNTFMASDLFLNSGEDPAPYRDSFKTLTYCLKSATGAPRKPRISSRILLQILLAVVTCLLNGSRRVQPVLRYSTLGLHMHALLESWVWVLENSLHAGRLTLKVGNYLLAMAVNVGCGIFVLYWISNIAVLHQLVIDTAEVVVATLRNLLHWLMGNPAGLKLNYALTNMLGQFFLYHINLWWTFLVVTKPLLELMLYVFLYFGVFGLTFQASLLADLLALVSFHVYCIYVYAARLYNLQVSALLALWRLFRGKKQNPLRHRVDSCRYSADQLFVGTLAFTILLFLLPTTLLYYAVFTSLRLALVALGGVLTQVRFLLQALPLYVTLLWMWGSPAVTSSVHLTVKSSNPLVLSARPISESWGSIVRQCVPDRIQPPPTVQWGQMLAKLASGQLIYPV